MPPLDVPKSDPLVVLLDEIELLSAQTRLMELYLKRAHTAAFGEVEKIQEQFRAKVTNLRTLLEDKEHSLSQHLASCDSENDRGSTANRELLLRISEQQHLLQRRQEEVEQRSAEVAALQERLLRLEAAKEQGESGAARGLQHAEQELNSQIERLQAELAQKQRLLEQRDATARQAELDAQDRVRSLVQELADGREWAEQQQAEIQRGERDRDELRQHIALLESSLAKIRDHAEREMDGFRQDAQAKIAALQSEIAHKTNLLTRNQATIADLERDIGATAETARSGAATQQALVESHVVAIARRDAEIAVLTQRIADLQNAAQEQRASAAELVEARAAFDSEITVLRAELAEKQQLLEQGKGNLQQIEQEWRNRNRELQGQLAAKEAVVESLEHNVRQTQIELFGARDAVAQIQQTLAERQDQTAKSEQLIETLRRELEQAGSELAAALERLRDIAEARNTIEQRAHDLAAQVEGLAGQVNEKHEFLAQQDEALRQAEARALELSAALDSTRSALEHQRLKAERHESDLAARIVALQEELERSEQAMREREAAAHQTEPVIKAQIADLEGRLGEKERMLEARSLEIGMLQAQVESLSGQAARLEATHQQALEDATRESEKTKQALQNEVTAARGESERQSALLDERQTAFAAVEQRLSAALNALPEQSAYWQALLENKTAELRQAESDGAALRARISELERATVPPAAAAVSSSEADANRIESLEQQLQYRDQKLAELEAALQQSKHKQEPQSVAAGSTLQLAQDQSEQLKAAQGQINALLERLAQLETARHMLQENASHELQQLRESFEARVGKLRAELAERDRGSAQDPASGEQQAATAALEEGYQRQIHDLQSELAEKRSLLDDRNEELIRVKTEMDSLQNYLARLKTGNREEVVTGSFAVELREEDAVEIPHGLANGSTGGSVPRPDPLQVHQSESSALAMHGNTAIREKTNRFTELESRVRSWNPEPEKDSVLGSNRRWSVGLFKRRWRA